MDNQINRTRWLVAICLLVAISICAVCAQGAKTVPAKVTGLFSNMTYNREGSDVLGMEIFIVYSARGYFVVYQSSEGEPSAPVILPANVSGSSVRFVIPPAIDSRGAFQGTVGTAELAGTFSGNRETVHLPRKGSYWQ
jgi:hypothetical protein